MLFRIASRLGSAVLRLAPRDGSVLATLSLCLATSLAWAGPLAGEAWARGDHLTPEQWGQHTQLVALGYAAHHGAAGSPAGSPSRLAPKYSAAPLAAPQIVGPVATLAPPAESLLCLAAEGALPAGPAAWAVAFGDSVIPSGLPAEPPAKPPPPGA